MKLVIGITKLLIIRINNCKITVPHYLLTGNCLTFIVSTFKNIIAIITISSNGL